jgi:L-asparaginase II
MPDSAGPGLLQGRYVNRETLNVEVTRGAQLESRHLAAVAVADPTGIVASAGESETICYFRSSAKPFQAIPLVTSGAADAFGFTTSELAYCCGSHNAQPSQQSDVRVMLDKVGLTPDALLCGWQAPADQPENARVTLGLVPKSPLQHCCSGKHTGMLATCVHLGYPIHSYLSQDHPLQQEILTIVANALGVDARDIAMVPDGCSVPTFAAPLWRFAQAYALLSAPSTQASGHSDELTRLRDAMLRFPENIAGEGELDTDLMKLTEGAVLAKLGAEGLICLAVPHAGLGIAIRVLDGSTRGLNLLVVSTLEQLGILDQVTTARLRDRLVEPVKNANGWTVGKMQTNLRLT